MKILQRLGAMALCLALLLSAAVYGEERNTSITLKKGIYITLGSYMGEPIIWRCVGEDANGMLLISRDILCFKAYGAERGRWDRSFLRMWLNSDAEAVNWGDSVPDESAADSNAYDSEPGFLTGFSAEELTLIKPVLQKSAVNRVDRGDDIIGSDIHTYNSNGNFADTIQNYDEAFCVMTYDRVFCPNFDQMEILATNYPSDFIAGPRSSAVDQSGSSKNRESRSNNYYWMRDGVGNAEFPDVARCVYPDGRVFFANVYDGSIGVRPAIYMEKELPYVSGSGYEAEPYVPAAGGQSVVPAQGSANENHFRATAYGPAASITEGDYVIMGSAYGSEIVWRCVDINENGPLMISEKVLVFHAFDATGGDHGNAARNTGGGNCWKTSTLRAWLNSSEPEGDKEWPNKNPPNDQNTGGVNGYSREAGFLNSFTPEELDCIKTVRLKTVINPLDIDETTVGTEEMVLLRNLNNHSNADKAFSNYDDEFIFLPSIEEARTVKEDFGSSVLALPTPEAVHNNERSGDEISADMTVSWWLRDADGQSSDPQGVRVITPDGWVKLEPAARNYIGVRPAFYLNMDTVSFLEGDGEYETPYRIGGHVYGEWFVAKEPGCVETGINRRICSVCGENEDETIAAAGHSFGEPETRFKGIYSVAERTCLRCGEVYREERYNFVLPLIGALAVLVLGFMAWKKRK